MRSTRAFAGPIVLGALLATPQLAFGQRETEVSPVEITLNARPGTEIRSDQLGEFLAKSIQVSYREEELRTALRLEAISRAEGVIGKWESGVASFGCYPTSCNARSWIREPGEVNKALAPGFGDRRKITLGRFVVINHEEQYMPRECEDATHALRVAVVSTDPRFANIDLQNKLLCLNVEGGRGSAAVR